MAHKVMNQTSCVADSQAASFLLWPAPPVANAANMLIRSTITWSTSDTPDTAASPTLEIIIESAMPTSIARNCSIMRGMISAARALLSKR